MLPHLFSHIKGRRGGQRQESEREAGKEGERLQRFRCNSTHLFFFSFRISHWSNCPSSHTLCVTYLSLYSPLSAVCLPSFSLITSAATIFEMIVSHLCSDTNFCRRSSFFLFFVQLLPFYLFPVVNTAAMDRLLEWCSSLIRVSLWHQSNVWLLTSRVRYISYCVAECLIYIPPLKAEQLGRLRQWMVH